MMDSISAGKTEEATPQLRLELESARKAASLIAVVTYLSFSM